MITYCVISLYLILPGAYRVCIADRDDGACDQWYLTVDQWRGSAATVMIRDDHYEPVAITPVFVMATTGGDVDHRPDLITVAMSVIDLSFDYR